MQRLTRRLLSTLGTLCVMALPALASAQGTPTSIQVEQFEPLPTQGYNILNVSSSDVMQHKSFSLGLFYHFSKDPLRLVAKNDPSRVLSRIVASQHKPELSFSFALWNRVELGAVLPLVAYQTGEDLKSFGRPGETVDGFALQDPRIIPKVMILDHEKFGGFGLAFISPLYLPLGDDESFNSDGKVRWEPRLVADWRHESGIHIAANVGYQLRPEVTTQNIISDDALRWALGFQAPTGVEDFTVIGSIFGSATFNGDRSGFAENANDPVEALGGLRFTGLPMNLVAQVGAGAGLTTDIGAPALRVFASIGYTPKGLKDRDEDGILDRNDRCPTDPEDRDGFEDEDGCPEYDNDKDGILDKDDKCPLKPEDRDGFQDKDGCPDPDNDRDGILDRDDKCPLVPGVPEEKGCPVNDRDKDGIPDAKDKCPDKPEDRDGFEDEDGCPDLDNDKDGIPDKRDRCPMKAEDRDGFQDSDGCPDPDNDGDRIPDVKDRCPNKAETYNGVKDDDGCPERTKSLVKVSEAGMTAKIYFKTGKADIQRKSFKTLDVAAATLKSFKEVTKVRVEGHTDDVGRDSANLELSKARARSVKVYLEKKGVDPKRLESEGYGETQPLCKDVPRIEADLKKARKRSAKRKLRKELKACRAENRRVQFKFTEINGKPVKASDRMEIKRKTEVMETVKEK